MKKTGKIVKFDGRFGIIEDEHSHFYFHVSDLSNKKMPQSLQDGNIVEFRFEDRTYNIKRAKNIKVLRKKYYLMNVRKLNNIIKNPLSRKYAYINDDRNNY